MKSLRYPDQVEKSYPEQKIEKKPCIRQGFSCSCQIPAMSRALDQHRNAKAAADTE